MNEPAPLSRRQFRRAARKFARFRSPLWITTRDQRPSAAEADRQATVNQQVTRVWPGVSRPL